MNKNVTTALKEMTEVEYFTLIYHLKTADSCRSIQKRHELTDIMMAEKLNISEKEFSDFRKGAYSYSLESWAKLLAIDMEYEIERVKGKVESQI